MKVRTRDATLYALVFAALISASVTAFAQELKPPPGAGIRACVAVGARKAAFKFGTESQLYVEYQPKDIAQAYIVDRSLWAHGLKPGQTIVKVTHPEFRPALKTYEDVNTWFIVTVTEKPTTDKCLCEGRGEKQCPGAQTTGGSTVEDKTKAGIAGALDPKKPSPITGERERWPLPSSGEAPKSGSTPSSPTITGTEAAPKTALDRPSPPQPAKPASPQPDKPGPTVSQGDTGTRSSPPPRPRDLPSPPPLPSPGPAVGGTGSSPTPKKLAEVSPGKAGTDRKEKESSPVVDKGPEPLTGSEMVFVDAGKSTTAKFKKRVESVRLSTSDSSVATVGYREGFGVTIKGNRPGRATVTVRGDIVRFEAGPGPVEQDIPFIFTYNVVVREAKEATGKQAKPRPNSFTENIALAVGKASRISFDKKAVDVKVESSNKRTADATVPGNVLTITGVAAGRAIVTARFKIPDETGTPEAFIFTYYVNVGKLLPAYYHVARCFTEESIRGIDRNIDTQTPKLAKVPEAQQAMIRALRQIQQKQRDNLQRLTDLYRRYQGGSITEDKFFEELAKPQGMSKEEYLRKVSLAKLRDGCPNPPAEVAQSEPGSAGGRSSGTGMDYILNPTDLLEGAGPSAGSEDDLSGGLKPPPRPTQPIR